LACMRAPAEAVSCKRIEDLNRRKREGHQGA
jgi:hypothetical protein